MIGIQESTCLILEELERTLKDISQTDCEKMVHSILKAKKVFVAGAGRSGFAMK